MDSKSIISDIVDRDIDRLMEKMKMQGWQRERIIKTYTRKVAAYPEGVVVHDGDCGIFNIELGVCTCGLHHCLMASSVVVIRELYPKYYKEKNNEGLISYMLQEFEAGNLYVKEGDDFVKVERPEPISEVKLGEILDSIFPEDKEGKEDGY